MSLSNERIIYLLQAYSSGNTTEDEESELFQWVEKSGENQIVEMHVRQLLKDAEPEHQVDWEQLYSRVLTRTRINEEKPVRRLTWKRVAVAASIITIFAGGMYFLLERNNKPAVTVAQSVKDKNDVLPGRNGATLTLDNGEQIVLDNASDGILVKEGNTNIKKQNGQVIYDAATAAGNTVTYNTISTPAGRQYALILADGTKVWLNASSSIRFPTMFAGNERRVAITGEAYFEVTHNSAQPFIVKMTNEREVEVLGTSFNINSYENEATSRTTLVEGKIKISSQLASNILNPGQQGKFDSNGKINITNDIDVDEVVAWKNGMFQFGNTPIDAVMRQLARWYDVEIEYKGTILKHFGGTISRDVNLSQVLNMLELTGEVKFTIEGKKIIATPV